MKLTGCMQHTKPRWKFTHARALTAEAVQRKRANRIPSPSRFVQLFPSPAITCFDGTFSSVSRKIIAIEEKTFKHLPAPSLMHHANFNQLNEYNIFLFTAAFCLGWCTSTMCECSRVYRSKQERYTSQLSNYNRRKVFISTACNSRFHKTGKIKWSGWIFMLFMFFISIAAWWLVIPFPPSLFLSRRSEKAHS